MRKILLSLVLAGIAMASSAKTYSIKVFQTVKVGNVELQPGDYRVEVSDQKAVIRSGKVQAEAPVKVENGDAKYDRTVMRMTTESTPHITEIRLGGTKTKLVFGEQVAP